MNSWLALAGSCYKLCLLLSWLFLRKSSFIHIYIHQFVNVNDNVYVVLTPVMTSIALCEFVTVYTWFFCCVNVLLPALFDMSNDDPRAVLNRFLRYSLSLFFVDLSRLTPIGKSWTTSLELQHCICVSPSFLLLLLSMITISSSYLRAGIERTERQKTSLSYCCLHIKGSIMELAKTKALCIPWKLSTSSFSLSLSISITVELMKECAAGGRPIPF